MLDQLEFLARNDYPQDYLDDLGIPWDILERIYDNYCNLRPRLEPITESVLKELNPIEEVHSTRSRIKDPEHLIKKIIRKRKDKKSFSVTPVNYTKKITDLIGIRALHLFKEQWSAIHDVIVRKWDPLEKPTANVRVGDPKEIIQQFKNKGCKVKYHPNYYRSVHYLIKIEDTIVAEIQVRTVFEEGWSEIDHVVRYPDELNLDLLNGYLETFNRLAGAADEMGSYVKRLKTELQNNMKAGLDEAAQLQQELDQDVDTLELDPEKKKEFKDRYSEKLSKITGRVTPIVTSRGILSEMDKLAKLTPSKCPVCGEPNYTGRGSMCLKCRLQREIEKNR